MKNKVQLLLIKIMLCVFLSVNLSGCWSARELNELKIAIGLGVDKSQSDEDVLITAQIVKPSEVRKISSEDIGMETNNALWNVSSTGKSVFQAIRDISKKTGYRIYTSHSQVIVFGNEIASKGLEKYFDFFFRAHEIRPNALILISRGTAAEVLEMRPEIEKLTAVYLANLVKGYGTTAHYEKISLHAFTNALMSKTTAPIAPLVEITYDKGDKNLYVSGMAVFKKTKMIGTLEPKESSGLLWATGEIKGGIIQVSTPNGKGNVVFEVMNAKTKITPIIQDGKITMHIEIKENSSLVEQSTDEDLAKFTVTQALEKEQEAMIRKEIMNAFEKSKELKADIFGFGEKVHKKYPSEWKELEKKWDEIYPSIEINLNIEAKIRKTEAITKPAAPEKEEKQ